MNEISNFNSIIYLSVLDRLVLALEEETRSLWSTWQKQNLVGFRMAKVTRCLYQGKSEFNTTTVFENG